MAANIIVTEKGETKKLSPKAVRAKIMEVNNWSVEEYRKNYDIFKNKLRNYEAYQEAITGKPVQRQSVAELLYRQAKSKERYGKYYEESMKMKQIKSFSAVSMSQSRKQVQRASYREKITGRYTNYVVNERFEGFIKKNEGAQKIVDAFTKNGKIENPVGLEQALSDYADKVDEMNGTTEINGETYGSDSVIDFDTSSYL